MLRTVRAFAILYSMMKLLEAAVEELRALPEDEQIAGIHHAMQQADRGEFASDTVVRGIFGRSQ